MNKLYNVSKNDKLIVKGNKLDNRLHKLNFIPILVAKANECCIKTVVWKN